MNRKLLVHFLVLKKFYVFFTRFTRNLLAIHWSCTKYGIIGWITFENQSNKLYQGRKFYNSRLCWILKIFNRKGRIVSSLRLNEHISNILQKLPSQCKITINNAPYNFYYFYIFSVLQAGIETRIWNRHQVVFSCQYPRGLCWLLKE